MKQNPPRILTISKPYVAKAYRHKLTELAEVFSNFSKDSDSDPPSSHGSKKTLNDAPSPEARAFAIGLITPPQWGSQPLEPDRESPAYWHRILPIAANGKNHFHFYWGLQKAILEFVPDVINIEEEHYSLVTFQVQRIARRLRIPTVFYTWQNIEKRYPPPFSWMESYVFHHAAAAVAGNQEAKDILHRKGFKKPVYVIPQMGVDPARFKPLSDDVKQKTRSLLGMGDHDLAVGYFGRLVPEKGLAILIDAMAGTDGRCKLLLCGDGPERQRLQSQVQALGLESRIHFKSGVPSTAVPEVMGAMDVLCLPSLTRPNWKEQFGRVLIEAMALGVVPIGSDSGEIPLVIGDAGLVVKEGDVGALKEAIQRLALNPSQRTALRGNGIQRVRDRYQNRQIASQFAKVFLSMIGK